MRSKATPIEEKRHTTGGLAIWRGDEYILIFLFAIICSPGLTFTIELLLLSSSLVILFGLGSGLDVFQIPPHRQAVAVVRKLASTPNFMVRLLPITLLSLLIVSCTAKQPQKEQTFKSDYPKLENFNALPEQIHVIGTVREISYGYCGIFCQGGFIKVDLETVIPDYDFKSVYLITACLSTDAKLNSKVDITATLHTGREEECYYKNFDKPKNAENLVFYQLNEAETRKVR